MALARVGLVLSLLSGANSAPCASGTIAVDVTSTGDIQNLATALACEGEGEFDITWFPSVNITERIDVANDKNVTVTGKGFPNIRGVGTGRSTGLFSVSNGSTLRLNGLVLEGGDAENGGAVHVQSSSSLFVFGCIFADSNATKGGAISSSTSNVHVAGNSSFGANSAVHGGAIYMDGKSTMQIDGSTLFFDNRAEGNGGAMFIDGSEVRMNGNTSFSHNSALDGGGAVYMAHSGLYAEGITSFSDNVADCGGAIEAYADCVINMDGNLFFLRNLAGADGGAMYYQGGCVVTMDGTTVFSNNSAGGHGGAISEESGCVTTMDGNTLFAHNSAGVSGGAVCTYTETTVNFHGTTSFTHNSAFEYGGAMDVSDDCVVNMDGNTIFADNSIGFDGGGIYMAKSNVTIDGHASFVDNSASVGGGIQCYEGRLVIAHKGAAWFTNNTARAGGGAIAITAALEVKINNTTFTSNTAKFGGAVSVASKNFHQRVYENCIFKDNVATEGGAAYFFGGGGVDYVASSVFTNNYASNGGAVYSVGALDLVSTSFVGNKADKEGMAMFVDSVFASSRVDYANVSFTDNAFFCPRGEYGYDAVNENVYRFETVCRGCSTVPNKIPESIEVSDNRTTPTCEELPRGTVEESSGTTVASLTLKEGYFRTSNESRVIIECYRSEACVGGDDPGKYCADGYKGPYCAICKEGFSRGFAYSCKECSNTSRRSVIALTLTVAVVALLVVASRMRSWMAVVVEDTVRENQIPRSFARSACSSRQWWIRQWLPLSAIKIVVVVWQVVYEFSSIAEAVYPRQYERFVSYLGFATFDLGILVWFSCVFSPDFFGRLLFTTIAPLVVLLMLAVAYYVVQKNSRNTNHEILVVRGQYVSAALFVVFFVYSSVSSTILQTFNCDLLDDAVHYLQADYSLTCWTPKHKAYILYASLMVVIYPLGIPSVFLCWLVRNRTLLKMSDRQRMSHLKPFDSIWGTYRPSRYYYEVVECFRRITLSAASVFFVPNSVNQIAVVLSLALVFLFLSESLSPFEQNADMGLYRWGNGVILSSMFVALLIRADGSPDESGKFSVLGGVLITANVVMIVAVMVQSVFLAREWGGLDTEPEELIPPVRRHPLSYSRSTQPAHLVGEQDDGFD